MNNEYHLAFYDKGLLNFVVSLLLSWVVYHILRTSYAHMTRDNCICLTFCKRHQQRHNVLEVVTLGAYSMYMLSSFNGLLSA